MGPWSIVVLLTFYLALCKGGFPKDRLKGLPGSQLTAELVPINKSQIQPGQKVFIIEQVEKKVKEGNFA